MKKLILLLLLLPSLCFGDAAVIGSLSNLEKGGGGGECIGTGTLGVDTVGIADINSRALYTEFTAPNDICVRVGYIRTTDSFTSSQHVKVVVWDNAGDVMAMSEEITGNSIRDLKSAVFATPFQVYEGVSYRVGYIADHVFQYVYSSDGSLNRFYDDSYVNYDDPTGLSWNSGVSRGVECYVKDN